MLKHLQCVTEGVLTSLRCFHHLLDGEEHKYSEICSL